VVFEGRAAILTGGASVSRVVAELLEAGVQAVLPGIERSHVAGEFRDLLGERCIVRSLINAGKRRLDSNLGDAVRTEGCGVQVGLVVAGEEFVDVVWLTGWSRRF
jgi:hypothetical protein